MSDLLQDLKYGVRILLRSPGFSAVVILILALGIGANTMIFSEVNAVLLHPLPYHDPDRLYQLDELNPKGEPAGISPADITALQQGAHPFESLATSQWQNLTLTGPEGPENAYGGKVSADCFRTLGRQPAIGRWFRQEEFQPGAPGVVILSDNLCRRRFGRDSQVVGRQLMINGAAHTIIAVMPPDFFVFPQKFELWTPWQMTAAEATNREGRHWPAVARLRSGVTLDQARAQAEAAFRVAAPEQAGKGWHVRLVSLASQVTPATLRSALLVLLGAVMFVLLIACLNIANLLLARTSDRSREIAVRLALGAGRLRVVRQLLTESLMLAGIGGAIGLGLGRWGVKALATLFLERVALGSYARTNTSGLQGSMDSTVLLFTLGLAVFTALAFGLIPALQASRCNLNSALKEGGRGSNGARHSGRLRNLMVIAETSLSLILLIGAGLMLRSLERLHQVDPGFDPERVLTVRVPLPTSITEKPGKVAYYNRILERLQSLAGVNAAGLIAPLPLGGVDANSTFAAEGRPVPAEEQQLVKLRAVSSGYFRAMGVPLRRGRVFQDSDGTGAPDVVVVNESLARRYFPNEDPIGRRVTMSDQTKGPWLTIIGVVSDVKYINMTADSAPEMYRDFRQFLFAPFATTFTLRTAVGDPMLITAALQREIRAVNPDQPISDLMTMNQVVSTNIAQPRFYAFLLATFAALALVLAAAGLYGVLSYSVSRRAHEIGIRMALGASRPAIFRKVVGQALFLSTTGVAIGLAGSFVLTRLIASQLYQVKPTDPLTFAIVPLVLIAVAVAASYLPARRATRVDPMIALRCE